VTRLRHASFAWHRTFNENLFAFAGSTVIAPYEEPRDETNDDDAFDPMAASFV
jgi:hypothetical protein